MTKLLASNYIKLHFSSHARISFQLDLGTNMLWKRSSLTIYDTIKPKFCFYYKAWKKSCDKLMSLFLPLYIVLRASMWNVAVITPILGLTWVFGVFSVNDDTVWFQYVFCICNSLQVSYIHLVILVIFLNSIC